MVEGHAREGADTSPPDLTMAFVAAKAFAWTVRPKAPNPSKRNGTGARHSPRLSSRRVSRNAFGAEPSEYPSDRGAAYEGLDDDENVRLAEKRRSAARSTSNEPAGNFRAKTGRLGDVLERGSEGSNYNENVNLEVNNDEAIEGTVVENGLNDAAPSQNSPNNVVDGGLNLEASILAGAFDASYVDTSQGTRNPTAVQSREGPTLGDKTVDDLYAEIASKNGIDGEVDFSSNGADGGAQNPQNGPTAPPVHARQVVDQFGNPVVTQPQIDVEVMDEDEQMPNQSQTVDGEDVEFEVGAGDSPVSPLSDGAVTVSRRNSAMDDLMRELDSSMYDDDLTVETVQLINVQFRIEKQVEFGEVLRMVGGHESMGAWSLRASPALSWSEGDVWVSDTLELPVDGVYVYKYVVTDASDAGKPVAWQKGNNQVLTLLAVDAPTLISQDDWSGDPSKAYTMRPDGSDKMQAETRLVQRLGDADAALHESRMEVMDLKVEVKTAQMQSMALREEARLSSNVRLKLKQQLSAEKKRSEVLEDQVFEWKQKFKQITSGPVSTPGEPEAEGGEQKA